MKYPLRLTKGPFSWIIFFSIFAQAKRLEELLARSRKDRYIIYGSKNFWPGPDRTDILYMKELLIHNGSTELIKVRSSDIIYVEAEGNYCCMYLAGGFKQQLWFNRQKFIAIINEQMRAEKPVFISVGRSFIVNLAYLYLINPIQGDMVLYDRATPQQIKLHASQDALNKLKDMTRDLYE